MTTDPESPPAYPDISDILARKAEGRRDLAARSWSEKIRRMEALREAVAPFARQRPRRPAMPPAER